MLISREILASVRQHTYTNESSKAELKTWSVVPEETSCDYEVIIVLEVCALTEIASQRRNEHL